jgi:uncharacterized protein
MIDKEFLNILACPKCKGRLEEERESLLCPACGLRYPVRDGIPVLLVEEAEESAGNK